jgi:hypothetical protein
MKTAWKAAVVFASLALVSCGGGGGNAAVSKTFNYGAAQAPTTSEQAAGSAAKTSVTASSGFGASPDANAATTIVSLADDLAASALGGVAVAAGVPENPRLRRALSTAATVPECTTSTPTSVTFNNCTQTDSGFTFTLNGSISAMNGTLTWNINGGFSGMDQGVSFNINLHQSGSLTVTASTVKGNALSEIGGSVSGNGQNVNFGVSTAAPVDLTYNASCVTSGTIEVKRVWSPRPNGATGPEFADVAVKLTWSDCDAFQVQHSM